MKKIGLVIGIVLLGNWLVFSQTIIDSTLEIGDASMRLTKNIVESLASSKEHTTFYATLKAADLLKTLKSGGPFTVFAPINVAFNNLTGTTLDSLLRPENKAKLTKLLTYHILSGKYNYNDIVSLMKTNNGIAKFKTISGGILSASLKRDKLILVDENFNMSELTIKNVYQTNGVIHVVNAVLKPK